MYCESRSWDKYVIKESIIMIKQWRQPKIWDMIRNKMRTVKSKKTTRESIKIWYVYNWYCSNTIYITENRI